MRLRTKFHLATRTFMVANLRQARTAKLRDALVLPQNVFGNSVPQRFALAVPLGELFLVFGGNFSRLFFFFLNLGGFSLQIGLGSLHFFFAGVDVDHHVENAVLVQTYFLLSKLNLVLQRFVLFVGFYVQGLVAILGNLALQVFYIAFELLAVGFVALGGGSGLFKLRFGPG